MALIAGASQYLAQATYSNKYGAAAGSTNLLSVAAGSVSMLDIGRNLSSSGLGISAEARALNSSYLESSSSTYNTLFSANATASNADALQIQILALRSSTPTAFDSPNILGEEVDETV